MMKRVFIALGAVALLALSVFGALLLIYRPIDVTHPALAKADLPPLVPLRRFYADASSRWRYQLSRDGKHMSWLESRWLKPALHVRPLEGGATKTFSTDDEVRWYAWSADSRYLLYQADRDGWENDVIVSIDVSKPDAEPRSYDFGKDVKSFLVQVPQQGSSTIIIGHNARDRKLFDLFRLDLASGETEPIGERYEQRTFVYFDKSGVPFARQRTTKDGFFKVFEVKAETRWIEKKRWADQEHRFVPLQAAKDGRMYAISDIGRDKAAFVSVDLATMAEIVIDANDGADYGGVWFDHVTGEPLIGFSQPGNQARTFFDPEIEALVGKLDLPEGAGLNIHSVTEDRTKMLVSVETSTAGFTTYLVDRDARAVDTVSVPGIAAISHDLRPVEPVSIKARDGLALPSYLTRPAGVDGPTPLVILIHGGPVWRAFGGWNSTHQWLANRGYTVLDVNYRGSSGYGRAFRKAAYGEAGRKMDDDISDARAWAVEQGIADPDRVAVMGGSWGGYKTLTALTRNPNLYRAGVAINAVSDLRGFFEEIPPYWQGERFWFHTYVGDPAIAANADDIADRSPVTKMMELDDPLLLIQGTNDVRVVLGQSDRLAERLRELGKPFDYVVLDGLGHQSRNWGWKTRLKVNRRIERFLAEELGGRADGFDYAVVGADILPAGIGK